jgi:hypothetical protein
MQSIRVVRMISALGIVSIAVAAPAVARAQSGSALDTPRPVAVGQATDTTRARKAPVGPNQVDVLTARRAAGKTAAGKTAAGQPAAATTPSAPPQAPVKVKPRKG